MTMILLIITILVKVKAKRTDTGKEVDMVRDRVSDRKQ
jgi:hypothetical protein